MNIIKDPSNLQNQIISLKKTGKTIGFVPTMGNLHEGHLSLIKQAKKQCDLVVCSIFVNPMQFGENEDYDQYPKTLTDDVEKLEKLETDFLLTPNNHDIYPHGKALHTSVELNRLTNKLCGKSRPGHFKGVTTIVNILFNIVQPDIAFFGKKDYQQYLVIKTMVADLMLPVKIIGVETQREKSGLAMSSRNHYLNKTQQQLASELNKTLRQAAEKIQLDLTLADSIIDNAIKNLNHLGFQVDYIELVRQSDLNPVKPFDKKLLIVAALWLNSIRLIDNLEINI